MEWDRASWNAAVAAAALPDFLQTWEWGDLKALTGWRAHRLGVRRAGHVVALCSLLERRIPGLGPLLYAPRGPLVDWSDDDAVAAIFAEIRRLAGRRRAVAVKCDPAVPRGDPHCGRALEHVGLRPLATGPNFESVQPRFVMRLDLAGRSEADLLAGMHPKTRYNVRLGLRRGVEVRAARSDELSTFYQLLLETARRDHFRVRSYDYFERLWQTCVEPGASPVEGSALEAGAASTEGSALEAPPVRRTAESRAPTTARSEEGAPITGPARVWVALWEGQMLAGAIAFLVGNTAWYLYGASSNDHRDLMASYALQWRMIGWARESGCTVYDFRGVSGDLDPANPLYGLYRFKKGFGAQLVELVGEWDWPCRPVAYWVAERGLPVVRRALAALRPVESQA